MDAGKNKEYNLSKIKLNQDQYSSVQFHTYVANNFISIQFSINDQVVFVAQCIK